ncbi:primosomal protein N' [Sessilibacter sp. MAH4]
MIIFEIALPVPLRALFDYLAPNSTPDLLTPESHTTLAIPDQAIGCRVEVPFGKKNGRTLIGIIVGTKEITLNEPNSKLKAIHRFIDETPIIDAATIELCQWVANYYHHSLGETLTTALPKKIRLGEVIELQKEEYWLPTTESFGLSDTALKNAPKQKSALDYIKKFQPSKESLKNTDINSAILKALESKHLIKKTVRENNKQKPELLPEPFILNDEQKHVINNLVLEKFQVHLLQGNTGSGKTEIYFQAIGKILASGQQALVLIPEISLGPQTISRFQERFKANIVALHSSLNDTERAQNWLSAKNTQADIIIGTRSSIFTPAPNLGLIIIDEEHDLSFKQQDGLRYNARDIALVRAQKLNIPVILGSATPSFESLLNADKDRFKKLLLTQKAATSFEPKIELEDLKNQLIFEGLTEKSLAAIDHTLQKNQQALVFLNRRGFAPALMCHHCGWISKCKHCDRNLTLHHYPKHLHCHHCDYQKPVYHQCPSCFSPELIDVGIGTEKLEVFLKNRFPSVSIMRVDRDTTQTKNAFDDLITKINQGEPCILVGTQMLVKGHHFPNMTLVVVANADSGLLSGDFRGLEKTAQILVQVAGRAGRAQKQGHVLIQTHHPDHPLFHDLFSLGYDHFAQLQLQDRYLTEMPPYTHLAILAAESENSYSAEQFLSNVRQVFQTNLPPSSTLQILGPMPATLEKIKNRFRHFIQLKAKSRAELHHTLSASLGQIEKLPGQHKLRWSLDIDPQELP